MASPSTVLSNDGTGAGSAQSSSTASHSPYKLVYGMEEEVSDGSPPTSPNTSETQPLAQSAPVPTTGAAIEKEKECLPHLHEVGMAEKGLRCAAVEDVSTSAEKGLPSRGGQVPLAGSEMAQGSDGRSPVERAESPLSLTDVKMEEVGRDSTLSEPSLSTGAAANITASSDHLPAHGAHPPPRYTSSNTPPPPYTPTPEGTEEVRQLCEKVPPGEVSPCVKVPLDLEDSVTPTESVTFAPMMYLGHSSVDAPRSENEASRKMEAMKQQALEPLQVILVVPVVNEGNIVLIDPLNNLPLMKFPIKYILFCARGRSEDVADCLCVNVKVHSTSSYHCHVLKASSSDMCQKVFDAIGKSFRIGIKEHEFYVKVEIHEDDGKGGMSPVLTEKDCFRLRPNVNKTVVLTLSQPQLETSKPLHIDRCFGLLVSAGKDVNLSEMSLLDNMKMSSVNGCFSVEGSWNINMAFLAEFNEETPKGAKQQYLTLAADFVIELVEEPVRFVRELKVKCVQPKTLQGLFSTKSCIKDPPHVFTLSLKKSQYSTPFRPSYVLYELKNKTAPDENSGTTDPARKASAPPPKPKVKEESERQGEEDDMVSGWGELEEEVEEKEELSRKWGLLLDDWEAKAGTVGHRPKELTDLCRKGIPGMMRGLIWNYLSGAQADPQLKESYRLLVMKESPAENVINWDMKRTFVAHTHFKEKDAKEFLQKICKAYSVYDPEVGYCQGFSFIIAVLLLQKLPEEEAFTILVKIMYLYFQRDLFKANFRELMLMFYQLDKLVESEMLDLSQHFQKNKIETHMFASQWFLTIFTAKFPLCFVYRVMDMFLCEGRRVLIAIALGLLKTARKELLLLDFEGILNYFRVSLPKKFTTDAECSRLFQLLKNYKVTDAKLKKLEKEYQSFLEQQAQQEDPVVRLERENKQLRDNVLRLEEENCNLAQELVESKVELRSQMDKLEERIDTLSKENKASKTNAEAAQVLIKDLREELKQSKDNYQRMVEKLAEDHQQHEVLVAQYKTLLRDLDERHQKQLEEMDQALHHANAKRTSQSANEQVYPEAPVQELNARELEMDLARAKLELVNEQCKNQELQNKLAELQNKLAELQTGKNKKKK